MASVSSDETLLKRKIAVSAEPLPSKRPRDDISPPLLITQSEESCEIVSRLGNSTASAQVFNPSSSSPFASASAPAPSIASEEIGSGEIFEEETVALLPKENAEEDAADEDEDEDDDVQESELSEVDSEDDESEENDASDGDSDDAERAGQSISTDTKDKGKFTEHDIKGKGKAKVEDSDSEKSRDEDDAGYLSEDPLDEVDLNNILPTRTRRRNRNVHFDAAEFCNKDDEEEDDDDSDA